MGSLDARGRWRYDTSTLEHVLSERNGQSGNHDNPTNTWQAHDTTGSSRRPKSDKRQSILDPTTRKGVFVHVESHEMRDMELRGKDLQVEEKAVGIPVRTEEKSLSSLSHT